jgi:hypothetical protein
MNADIINYMDKTEKMNNQLRQLMAGGSFSEILERCQQLRKRMDDAKENSTDRFNELTEKINFKTQKDSRLNLKKEKKNDVLETDKKEIEKFEDLANQRLDTIEFKKLPKVKRDREVEGLFKFFFIYLYKEDPFKFDYSAFVKFALKKNKAEFKKRLALFEIQNLGKNGLEILDEVETSNSET